MASMYISWQLDHSEEIEPASPLGQFCIRGVSGEIRDTDVFLDSFFEALIRGLEELEVRDRVDVDLVDEPYPLRLVKTGEVIRVAYREDAAENIELRQFKIELRSTVSRLVAILDETQRALGEPELELQRLRAYRNSAAGARSD